MFDVSSNMLAEQLFGMVPNGTHTHTFVMVFMEKGLDLTLESAAKQEKKDLLEMATSTV